MDKLLIIDGSQLLFQSFYGMPNKIFNKNGEQIEAVICFAGILRKTIAAIEPSHLLVVFDGERPLERKQLDSNYKAGRVDYSAVETTDNPFAQLPLIKQVLNYYNISWVETTDKEADDFIAGICNNYSQNMKIVVSSSDKDFLQLINNNVNVFVYRGKLSSLYTPQTFEQKFGFSAKSYLHYKCIIGDSSDNICGIKGVGIKTATTLMQNYSTLQNVYANINKLKPKLAETLNNAKVQLKHNFLLMNLLNNIQKYDLQDCEIDNLQINVNAALKALNLL